jgi:cellulose synthase/poly-beta-1,6-N-acetylglucosamine synthase-like glycosyltransferase
VNYYLDRFSVREQLIPNEVAVDLGIIVVIPCCNEPDLVSSLKSLAHCDMPSCGVEVITVINASEAEDKTVLEQNKVTLKQARQWSDENTTPIKFHFITENQLPKKYAGVGLARKIGMDEAVRRFEAINNPEGVILCFDADAKCDKNYLVEVEKHFKLYLNSPACSIHFEHPIDGDEFSTENYNGILQYELHLRVYKNGLKFCGLPYAFHTIGSSMAVRSNAYQKQNGMNKRKAGEDFYFLQKLIPLGNFTELKTTKVIPSPRVSDRVPFGTGKAMQNWLEGNKQELLSYHPQSYVDLKQFCEQITTLFRGEVIIQKSVQEFFKTIDFDENVVKIRNNSTSETHFVKLFYNWFNAFKVLKYMHFARDNYYPDVPVFEAANELLKMLGKQKATNLKGLLLAFREIDTN